MQDYLYNDYYYYWLGSPCSFHGPGAWGSGVGRAYSLYLGNDLTINESHYVRPVVTLKANTNYTGSGTTTDPFVVN